MTMILTAIDELEKAGYMTPDSEIKSIPFIASSFLNFAEDVDDYADEDRQTKVHIKAGRLISYLKQHKITLNDDTGIKGTEKRVKKFDIPKCAYNKFPKTNRWGMAAETTRYAKRYSCLTKSRIGGDNFDITKLPKSERLRYSYGPKGKDPYTAEAKKWFVYMEEIIRKGNQPSDS
jgi:hypothetical protein